MAWMFLLAAGLLEIVWSFTMKLSQGIGAVGAFIVGVVALGERVTIARVVAAALVVTGLSIMKLTTSS